MKNNTALSAEKAIIFISDAHEKFYYEKLKEVRYQDVYHKALVYCLGISDDTMSAPMIKCKKTPKKKCRFMAERRKKR